MKRIIIASEKGKKIIDDIREKKRALSEKFSASMPPKEVKKWMNKQADKTFELNKGKLNRESYILGMYNMWNYVYTNKLLK